MPFWSLPDITKDVVREHTNEKIENLSEFEIWKIRDETCSYIFQEINGADPLESYSKLSDFIKNFDDIYYLSVHPSEIEKFKDNPAIYEILKRYEHWSEFRKLELMIFKMRAYTEEQKQQVIEKLKEKFWDDAEFVWFDWKIYKFRYRNEWKEEFDIKLDDTKYIYTVWFFWWTSWRNNSYYMWEIRKLYPVKELIK